jgi:hypothetical protein
MKTYQDSLDRNPIDFITEAIKAYQQDDMYKWAIDGKNYVTQQNTTIMKYRKLIYDMAGKAVPDNYSANYKTATNFFNRYCTQLNQYLLKNGVTFQED